MASGFSHGLFQPRWPSKSCLRSVSLELAEIFPPQALLLGGVDGFDDARQKMDRNGWEQTPFLGPKLEVPTLYKAFVRAM